MLLYCFGLNDQLVVDIKPLARPEYINVAIKTIRENTIDDFQRVPEKFVGRNFVEELEQVYGIKYLAPADARILPVADASIDLVATTSTLEHIPPFELKRIIKELHRVCHDNSVISMKISYNDHYAHGDRSITSYNYFKYSKFQWALLNPDIHYQNRLREVDFKKFFDDAGFDLIEESAIIPENAVELLDRIEIHNDFAKYETEDLLKTYGNLVYMKAAI